VKIPGCQYGIGEMVVIHGQIATALEWRYDTSIGKMSYLQRGSAEFGDGTSQSMAPLLHRLPP
jgi:hypothetical protein